MTFKEIVIEQIARVLNDPSTAGDAIDIIAAAHEAIVNPPAPPAYGGGPKEDPL